MNSAVAQNRNGKTLVILLVIVAAMIAIRMMSVLPFLLCATAVFTS